MGQAVLIPLAVAAVTTAATTLLAPKPPQMADQQAQPQMPTADDEAVRRAKRLELTRQASRGGRASTMLATEDKLGG
jgi:hypothetical protein